MADDLFLRSNPLRKVNEFHIQELGHRDGAKIEQ